MTALTLNQILKRIETQATSHKQVAMYRQSVRADRFLPDAEYPLVFCVPGSIYISTNNSPTVNYRFYLGVCDRHLEDMSNLFEVLSDTSTILIDIISLLRNEYFNDGAFDLQLNTTAEIFSESDGDIVAGYGLEIEVITPFFDNTCDIPL